MANLAMKRDVVWAFIITTVLFFIAASLLWVPTRDGVTRIEQRLGQCK